uniref:Putative ormdl family n=1 Tax=Ixodes ricinus TaxID=34613 RepID=V5GI94_IXORI
MQFTATRKFLTVVPVVLFFLTSFYTKLRTSVHFAVNFCSLMFVLIPKLAAVPQGPALRDQQVLSDWRTGSAGDMATARQSPASTQVPLPSVRLAADAPCTNRLGQQSTVAERRCSELSHPVVASFFFFFFRLCAILLGVVSSHNNLSLGSRWSEILFVVIPMAYRGISSRFLSAHGPEFFLVF